MATKKTKKTKGKKDVKKAAAKKAPAKKAASKGKKTDKRKGQPGTHPPHPRCPKCEKAMYKTMVKGKPVKKEDPWAFCRHPDCELYGVDQSGEAAEENMLDGKAAKKAAKAPAKAPAKKVAKKVAKDKKGGKDKKGDKIKKALLDGKLTQAEIAEKFDCSRKKVRAVRNALQDDGQL